MRPGSSSSWPTTRPGPICAPLCASRRYTISSRSCTAALQRFCVWAPRPNSRIAGAVALSAGYVT
jgi:hypothetical protein